MQQMQINKAIKKYGDKAKDVGFKDMKQLNDRQAVSPIHLDTLTNQERDKMIDSLFLVEEKRENT